METNNSVDDEAPKDPGIAQPMHQGYTEGHRSHTVFVGVHMPGSRRHSHRRHRIHRKEDNDSKMENERPITPPAQRVHFILGGDVDDTHESHPLFSEMEELVKEGDDIEWKETARWIKFEEDVEEGGNRWSKPHVATLSLHSLFELRSLMLNGSILLDMEANSLDQIADNVCNNLVETGNLPSSSKEKVKDALLRRHRHQHEREAKKRDNNMSRLPIIRSLAEIGRNQTSSKNLQQALTTNRPTSSYNLHGTTSAPGAFDEIIPSPPQLSLLSPKDQRGCYLAVPTGDTVVSHRGEIGITTTWFHSGCSNSSIQCTIPSSAKVDDHPPSSLSASPADGGGSTTLKNVNDSGNGKFLSVPGFNFFHSNSGEEMIKSPSTVSMQRNASGSELNNGSGDMHRSNTHFMRKIPQGAEASNILVGEVDFLEKTLSAFVRLNHAAVMGDLTEVPVPTRFLFILLGPPGSHASFHEIGRAMATLMSDEIFHEVAYRARKRDHLLAGIDEFLDAVTVLPPGEWDPAIRIEPPAAIPSQEVRKRPPEKIEKHDEIDEEEEEQKLREESGLSRTGKLFGGLKNDLKRKAPWYISDFKDALSLQCVASWIFLYFACLTPIITFGGLLGDATQNNMAALESLVSGFVSGMLYGFFSGQPLTILGSTGPVLIFESIMFDFCKQQEWDYMSFRFWIGTWIAVILAILVAIDASALVCYITRFTEENFATLIAFIFIKEAIEKVVRIGSTYPIHPPPGNFTSLANRSLTLDGIEDEIRNNRLYYCLQYNGTMIDDQCTKEMANSNVFLMSVILFLGTFVTSIILKDFKNALFFPAKVRQIISDFSVIIAILSMSFLDWYTDIGTPKLQVPTEFKPTRPDRGWIIEPFHKNPMYTALIAVFPALLGTILIFMDQQITAVIVNRKENKLKKGCGYHLDLFILAILIQICSILGIPWFVAATVLSINHVNSLKLESECAAPGEKPQFLGVKEQRVTHILIFLMIGISVLMTPILCHIPMPVLFGVFLYMGVASLKGLQFFDRLLIIFMPVKYQPDYMFLRQVPLKRVHLFTSIQFACFVLLLTIKSITKTKILFPLMLVVMIGVRKLLDYVFSRRELKILDDIMPEMVKRQAADDMHSLEDGNGGEDSGGCTNGIYRNNGNDSSNNMRIPLSNGNLIPNKSINISEEMNKSSIWKNVNNSSSSSLSSLQNQQPSLNVNTVQSMKYKKCGKQYQTSDGKMKIKKTDSLSPKNDNKRLTTMTEEDVDEYSSAGIIISKDNLPKKSNGQNISQV